MNIFSQLNIINGIKIAGAETFCDRFGSWNKKHLELLALRVGVKENILM